LSDDIKLKTEKRLSVIETEIKNLAVSFKENADHINEHIDKLYEKKADKEDVEAIKKLIKTAVKWFISLCVSTIAFFIIHIILKANGIF